MLFSAFLTRLAFFKDCTLLESWNAVSYLSCCETIFIRSTPDTKHGPHRRSFARATEVIPNAHKSETETNTLEVESGVEPWPAPALSRSSEFQTIRFRGLWVFGHTVFEYHFVNCLRFCIRLYLGFCVPRIQVGCDLNLTKCTLEVGLEARLVPATLCEGIIFFP